MSFHREYLVRLPLPLAQLYSRAHNAKDARGRHDSTVYLFEALVKSSVASLLATYAREAGSGGPSMDETDSDANRVKEAGCDYETDTVEQTTGTQRQFRAMGVPMGHGEDAEHMPHLVIGERQVGLDPRRQRGNASPIEVRDHRQQHGKGHDAEANPSRPRPI